MTKLLGLSDSASLSHRHLNRRMSVHPQKMNSLSAAGVLGEFIQKCIYSMNFDDLA